MCHRQFALVLLVIVFAGCGDSAEVHFNRGKAWTNKGEHDKAIADFNKAIQLDPRLTDAFYFRGGAWYQKGEYDKAFADLNEAIRLNPEFAEAYYNRGLIWEHQGNNAKALADWKKARELGFFP